MEIESIRHKALRAFAETGRPKGLPGNLVERLQLMIAHLARIDTADELKLPPNYEAHELTGDRKGVWSLTVTKNWRMTFRIIDGAAIADLDLEDYHRWLSSFIPASQCIRAHGCGTRWSNHMA